MTLYAAALYDLDGEVTPLALAWGRYRDIVPLQLGGC